MARHHSRPMSSTGMVRSVGLRRLISVSWQAPTFFHPPRKITKKGYDPVRPSWCRAGAVVMSSRAPIGHLGIASVPLCTNQGCKSFIPSEAVESKFLYHALRYALDDIRALGSGATFKEVAKGKLSTFAIPLPPLDEQARIATWLDRQASIVSRVRAAAQSQLDVIDRWSGAVLLQAFEP